MPRGRPEAVDPKAVALILRFRRRGWTYREIAHQLDAREVPTPAGGVRWYPATVWTICKRRGVK